VEEGWEEELGPPWKVGGDLGVARRTISASPSNYERLSW